MVKGTSDFGTKTKEKKFIIEKYFGERHIMGYYVYILNWNDRYWDVWEKHGCKGSFVFETKSKEKNFISEKYFVER